MPIQRIVLAFTFLFVSSELLYVWMQLPPRRWYSGALSAKLGSLITPTVWIAILQFYEDTEAIGDGPWGVQRMRETYEKNDGRF
jgi:hypothetical protein